MRAADVMHAGALVVSADDTVRFAAAKMASATVDMLPVEDCGVLVGVVTDRDIVVRCAARGKDAGRTSVREIMTPGVVYCFEDQHVRSAAHLMESQRIRHLAVLNRDSGLVGTISLDDLAAREGAEGLACEVMHLLALSGGLRD